MDVYNCAICLEVYTAPLVTPCGHSFCAHCLLACQQCPLCKREITHERCAPNYQLQDLLTALGQQAPNHITSCPAPLAPAEEPQIDCKEFREDFLIDNVEDLQAQLDLYLQITSSSQRQLTITGAMTANNRPAPSVPVIAPVRQVPAPSVSVIAPARQVPAPSVPAIAPVRQVPASSSSSSALARNIPPSPYLAHDHLCHLLSTHQYLEFEEAIAQGYDIERRDEHGRTLLLAVLAVLTFLNKDHEEIVRNLVARRCNTKAVDNLGNTALHYVAVLNSSNLVEYFWETNAEVANKCNLKPMDTAVQRDNVNFVRSILAKPNAPSASHLLLYAVQCNALETVNLTLTVGGDVNVGNAEGHSLLMLAINGSYSKVTNCLMGAGAPLNFADKRGLTVLHHFCYDIYLVLTGAPTRKINSRAATVHTAIFNSPVCPTIINQQTQEGYTALHLAVYKSTNTLLKKFLSMGANPNIAAHDGNTPLHTAAVRGEADYIGLLLLAGADSQAVNNAGKKPVDLAGKRSTRSRLAE